MQYKGLKFNNEVINALYSVDSTQYWKYYAHVFTQQANDLTDKYYKYKDKEPSGNHYLDMVKQIHQDILDLSKDLAIINHHDPIIQILRKSAKAIVDHIDLNKILHDEYTD